MVRAVVYFECFVVLGVRLCLSPNNVAVSQFRMLFNKAEHSARLVLLRFGWTRLRMATWPFPFPLTTPNGSLWLVRGPPEVASFRCRSAWGDKTRKGTVGDNLQCFQSMFMLGNSANSCW